MSAREMISDSAFAVARAASRLLDEKGCEALPIMQQLDKLALKLFEIAKLLDNPDQP